MTTSAVCTLFEGSYHFGVAALANSLHEAGFRGTIYAGHRGPLPNWALRAQPVTVPGWDGAFALRERDAPEVVFLPLATSHHLTNHKPEFLLRLLDGPARSLDVVFYADPDICVTAPWRFFEEWATCGAALCEDVNSPLPEHHPRRVGWRRYFAARGIPLRYRCAEYVNGGFVGVGHRDRAFIEMWRRLLDLIADEVGSLGAASVEGGSSYRSTGFANCFDCTDQDALNAALEASDVTPSIVGQQAMGFRPGAALVPHALGPRKPWQRRYLAAALRGEAPRLADKTFWDHADGPFQAHREFVVGLKRLEVATGAAIGRFVRRA